MRTKKGLPTFKLKEFSNALINDVTPKTCHANIKNPAFARGLSYTFFCVNTYSEKLAEFTVNQQTCQSYQ